MKKAIPILTASMLPLSAVAEFSYQYIEVRLIEQTVELDGGFNNDEIEGDGAGIYASFDINNVIIGIGHAEGEIDRVWGYDINDLDLDYDIETTSFFIGGHGEPNEQTSAWAGAQYTIEKHKTSLGDLDFDVLHLGGGIRYSPVRMLELNANAAFVYIKADQDGDDDNDIQLGIGARFQPLDWLSFGAGYKRQVDADSDIFTLDARFQF